MTYALLAQDPAAPGPGGGKQQGDVPFFANPLYMMMLFSDGVDTASLLSDRQVLEIARRSDVTVYPIGIRDAPWLTGIGRAAGGPSTDDRFLRDLADTSGGRLVYAEDNRDLSRTFTRVIDEFNSRYVLGYAPTGVSGRGWHRVEVRLENRKGTVVSRRGYFRD